MFSYTKNCYKIKPSEQNDKFGQEYHFMLRLNKHIVILKCLIRCSAQFSSWRNRYWTLPLAHPSGNSTDPLQGDQSPHIWRKFLMSCVHFLLGLPLRHISILFFGTLYWKHGHKTFSYRTYLHIFCFLMETRKTK